MSDKGHNSGGVAAEQLRSFVSRIEKLNDEKAALTVDIREVYAEAGMTGFDKKALRALIAERAKDRQELEEQQQLIDLYRNAIGDLDGTPLGQAALDKVVAE